VRADAPAGRVDALTTLAAVGINPDAPGPCRASVSWGC